MRRRLVYGSQNHLEEKACVRSAVLGKTGRVMSRRAPPMRRFGAMASSVAVWIRETSRTEELSDAELLDFVGALTVTSWPTSGSMHGRFLWNFGAAWRLTAFLAFERKRRRAGKSVVPCMGGSDCRWNGKRFEQA